MSAPTLKPPREADRSTFMARSAQKAQLGTGFRLPPVPEATCAAAPAAIQPPPLPTKTPTPSPTGAPSWVPQQFLSDEEGTPHSPVVNPDGSEVVLHHVPPRERSASFTLAQPALQRQKCTCAGEHCLDIACADVCQTNGAGNAQQWLHGHGIVKHQRCPKHPEGGVRPGRHTGEVRCDQQTSKRTWCYRPLSACRFFTPKESEHEHSYDTLLDFLRGVAAQNPFTAICNSMQKDHDMVKRAYTDKLVSACALYISKHLESHQFDEVQIGETCIGGRKYHKGPRVGWMRYWAVSFTHGDTTIWHLVRTRDRATLESLVRKHVPPHGRAVITTDGWKGYTALTSIPGVIEHNIVSGHAKRSVTPHGEHTDHAEAAHDAVKRVVKAMWGGSYGVSSHDVAGRLAIVTTKSLPNGSASCSRQSRSGTGISTGSKPSKMIPRATRARSYRRWGMRNSKRAMPRGRKTWSKLVRGRCIAAS
jgi:hypothetical protein